jgi:predicted permease
VSGRGGRPIPRFLRVYGRALRLLPRGFREARADAMQAMLEEEWWERSRTGRVLLAVRASLDLLGTIAVTRTSLEAGRPGWAVGLPEDLRASLRSLGRAPLFTGAAVFSLALGVGGVATVYGVTDRLLLRPIGGVSEGTRLVELVPGGISYPAYQDFRDGTRSLEGLAAHRLRSVALEPGGSAQPRPAQAALVSGEYFAVLDVPAALGRVLTDADNRSGAPPVAVLSHALWVELGSTPDVLGSSVRVNGVPYDVVGVAPADFSGLRLWAEPALWITIESWPLASRGRTPDPADRRWWWLQTVGRLSPGVDVDEASAEVRAVAGRIGEANPGEADELGDVRVVPLRTRAADAAGDLLEPLLVLLALVVGLALLAAASNVANLLLARATVRTRELGIRTALGADRYRLGRLLGVESALLVSAGLIGGLGLASLALRALAVVRLPNGIGFEDPGLRADGRLLLLCVATLAIVTTVAGLSPALRAARSGAAGLGTVRSAGGGRQDLRLRGVFVGIQVAVGVVLLSGTALFGRSLLAALRVDLGLDAERLGVIQVDASLFNEDAAAAADALGRLVQRLREEPGIVSASWSTLAPLSTGEDRESFEIVGRTPAEGEHFLVEVSAVGPEYFETTGIRLLRGGPPGTAARRAPVAVVNEAMARRYWPGEDPLGARVVVRGQEVAVVAVAADARLHGFATEAAPLLFGVLPEVPPLSGDAASLTLLVSGPGVGGVLARAGEIARSMDTRVVVGDASSGTALLDFLLLPQRMGGAALLGFAILAVTLALTGVYGVVAFGVQARLREFGVRLTLGAKPLRVTAEVMKRSVGPVLGGLAVGAVTSLLLTRGVASVLYGVAPTHAGGAAIAVASVLFMALLATWIPARRAGRVDPAAVLSAD